MVYSSRVLLRGLRWLAFPCETHCLLSAILRLCWYGYISVEVSKFAPCHNNFYTFLNSLEFGAAYLPAAKREIDTRNSLLQLERFVIRLKL